MDQTLYTVILFATALVVLLPAVWAATLGTRRLSPVAVAAADRAELRSTRASLETRRLIGDEAFAEMRSRVESLMALHAADDSESLWLCSEADTPDAHEAVHALLPGMPLRLADASRGDMQAVEVYSGNLLIGSFLLTEAEKALRLLRSREITGVYVAEQNAYGAAPRVSMKVVIFHTAPKPAMSVPEAEVIGRMMQTAYKYISSGLRPVVVYQN